MSTDGAAVTERGEQSSGIVGNVSTDADTSRQDGGMRNTTPDVSAENPAEPSRELQAMEVDEAENEARASDVEIISPSASPKSPDVSSAIRLASSSIAVQTSPGLYLKQHLQNKSPDDFRQERKRTKPEEEAEADDAQCCSICFEPWSNSGEHRLASLNCGHLFGRSCIERWLKSKGNDHKCPQCNATAKRKHIRNIYAKSVQAIDTTERDEALNRLEQEKAARTKAEMAEAHALLQFQLAKAEADRVKEELKRHQELIENLRRQCLSQAESSQSSQPCSQPSTSAMFTAAKDTGSYSLQTSFTVAQNGARVMAFDNRHGILVVSRPSPNQLFPGFGVMKVSCLDSKHTQYVSIHKKPVRDCAFNNRGDGLLLTASMDKSIKITSILSNTVVQSYPTSVPAWCCSWDSVDSNYMYCGLANGVTSVFDIRNTAAQVKDLSNQSSVPVISVVHVAPSPTSQLRPGGVLTCTLEGGCFWEHVQAENYVPHKLVFPEGSCVCLSYEPSTRHCMVSLRPSRNFNKARHVVCSLQGKGIGRMTAAAAAAQDVAAAREEGSICTSQVVQQCVGGSIQRLLARSAVYLNPSEEGKLLVCAGDENTKSTMIWDGSNGNMRQKLVSPDQTPVLDVVPFNQNTGHFLGSITEQKLAVYKWCTRE